jgi:hypothetical protein
MKGVWRDEGVKAVEPTHDEKKSIHDRILKDGMCLACGKQCDDNHARSSAHQRVLKEECQLDRLSAVLHAGSWGWPAAMGFRLLMEYFGRAVFELRRCCWTNFLMAAVLS